MPEVNEVDPALLHNYLSEEQSFGIYETPIYSNILTTKQFYFDKELYSNGGEKRISTVKEPNTNRTVAMAEMKNIENVTDFEKENFLREALLTSSLEHPNIVPVYDVDLNSEKQPYFTMKFLNGGTLKRVIRELSKGNPVYTEKYTLSTLLEIFLKVCDAIAYAHMKHIVHLDIKPSNIMIGDFGEIYVCDWGLAKLLNSHEVRSSSSNQFNNATMDDITLTGEVKGTPGYMAPEQVSSKWGEKNERTDIYALGSLLYTILTLERPYSNLDVQRTLKATVKGKNILPQNDNSRITSTSLYAVCMKAMESTQNQRYLSVNELISDIHAYQQGFIPKAEPKNPIKNLLFLVKRNRLLTYFIIFVGIAGLAIGVTFDFLLRKELSDRDKIISKHIDDVIMLVSETKDKIALAQTRLKGKNTDAMDNLNKAKEKIQAIPQSIKGLGNALVINSNSQVKNGTLPFTKGTISFWFFANDPHKEDAKLLQLGDSKWFFQKSTNSLGVNLNEQKEFFPKAFLNESFYNKWHHLAITVDHCQKIKLYVNGMEQDVKLAFSGDMGVSLGCWFADNEFNNIKGYLDDVAIWSTPLRKEQITNISKTREIIQNENLVAYYKFDRNLKDSTKQQRDFSTQKKPEFSP